MKILIVLCLLMTLAMTCFAMTDNEVKMYIGKYVAMEYVTGTPYTYYGTILDVHNGIVEIATECCGVINLGTCWITDIKEIHDN